MNKEEIRSKIEEIYGPTTGDLENLLMHMFNFFSAQELEEFLEHLKEEELL